MYISNFIIKGEFRYVYGQLHIFLRGKQEGVLQEKPQMEERRRGKGHLRAADVLNDVINFAE